MSSRPMTVTVRHAREAQAVGPPMLSWVHGREDGDGIR